MKFYRIKISNQPDGKQYITSLRLILTLTDPDPDPLSVSNKISKNNSKR